MSTNYRAIDPVPYSLVLEKANGKGSGLTVGIPEGEDGLKHHWLYDGNAYLHIYTRDGSDTSFVRYGGNEVSDIIETLEEMLDTEIISEYDDRYFENDKNSYASRGEITLNLKE